MKRGSAAAVDVGAWGEAGMCEAVQHCYPMKAAPMIAVKADMIASNNQDSVQVISVDQRYIGLWIRSIHVQTV